MGELFAKIADAKKSLTILAKNSSWIFDTVLNVPLSTYPRKLPCADAFFKILQNSQENTCAGLFFKELEFFD